MTRKLTPKDRDRLREIVKDLNGAKPPRGTWARVAGELDIHPTYARMVAYGIRVNPPPKGTGHHRPKGEGNGQAILTDADVMRLRAERAKPNPKTYPMLKREYGLSVTALYNAVHGYTWGHLPLIPPKE